MALDSAVKRGAINEARFLRDKLVQSLSPQEVQVYKLVEEDEATTTDMVAYRLKITQVQSAQIMSNLWQWHLLDRWTHRNQEDNRWRYAYGLASYQLRLFKDDADVQLPTQRSMF